MSEEDASTPTQIDSDRQAWIPGILILVVAALAILIGATSCSSIEDRYTAKEIKQYGHIYCADGTMDMPEELMDRISKESKLLPRYWSGPLWDRWTRFGKNSADEYRVIVFFDLYLKHTAVGGQVVKTDYPVKWSFKALGWWDDSCSVTLDSIDALGPK